MFIPSAILPNMQMLSRTARGMMCCERAIRVLAEMEYPKPRDIAPVKYDGWLASLSEAKFTYVVASQASQGGGYNKSNFLLP